MRPHQLTTATFALITGLRAYGTIIIVAVVIEATITDTGQ
jgi:hypothetical protein